MKARGTVVVTGGCGYIGSHTIIELVKHMNYDVVSIDNYSNSSPAVLRKLEEITGKKILNYEVDLCDLEKIKPVFDQINNIVGIIHFAAFKSVPDSVASPITYYRNNLNSLLNVLKICEDFKIPRLIFSSSCSVYGNVETLPVSEITKLNKAESPYGRTKQMGEEILEDFAKVSSTQVISLRYFNPVGAHESGLIGEPQINEPNNLVPVITQTAIGIRNTMTVFGDTFDTRDGSCIRDYVHVSDIARAHIDALSYLVTKENCYPYEVFNLGTGEGVTVLEAIRAFTSSTGVELNYRIGNKREGDVASIYSDSSKAFKQLKWQAKIPIQDMMKSAWNWQKHLKK